MKILKFFENLHKKFKKYFFINFLWKIISSLCSSHKNTHMQKFSSILNAAKINSSSEDRTYSFITGVWRSNHLAMLFLILKISFSVSSTANRSPGSQQKFGQDTEDDFKGRSTRV
jgi:hypothetical protein